MTLLEIMIVTVLIATLATVIAPRLISALGNPVKGVTTRIATLTRQLHYSSKLRQKTFRLVVDLTRDKQSFWVESGSSKALLPGPDATPTPKPRGKAEEEAQAKNRAFQPDSTYTKKPIELPKGARFEYVEQGVKGDRVTDGQAYIYFFPSGLAELAAIHITDSKDHHWTIAVHPLTGHAKIETREIHLKDFEGEL